MADDNAFVPPDGFIADAKRGPFTQHNGPIYRKHSGDVIEVGLHVLDRHCNGLGFLHGGMISAFADGALAWCVWTNTRQSSVTMRLAMDFLEVIKLGDWLVARPTHIATQGEVVHVEANLIRNETSIAAHANAVFHLIRRKSK